MKTSHNNLCASLLMLVFIFSTIQLSGQDYAAKTYKLDAKDKTWLQKIRTYPPAESLKWHTAKSNSTTGALSARSSYSKFKSSFPELKTQDQYVGAAILFKTKRPSGTIKKFLKNKNLVQYHAASNVFAAYDSKGLPITFFRPKEGKKYYDKLGVVKTYTFPGYVPKKSSRSSSTASASSSSNSKSYYLKNYRPEPGTSTWLRQASTFPRVSSSKWSSTSDTPGRIVANLKYEKHKASFPELKNEVEYIGAAHQFKNRRPKGTFKKTLKNGDYVQYNEESNVFAAYDEAGLPKTMFRPIAGKGYFDDLEKVKAIQYDGYGVQNKETMNGSAIPTSSNYLVNEAYKSTSIVDKNYKSLSVKKSWDAVKQMLVISKTLTATEARSIDAATQLVNSSDPLIESFSSIPEGYLIGFFAPTSTSPMDVKGPAPGKKEKLIHLMISAGNGKAIGSNNKTIEYGELNGWIELKLSKIQYDENNRFFTVGKGSATKEVYVRSYDPKKGFKNREIKNAVTNIDGIKNDVDKRKTGYNKDATTANISSTDLLYDIAKKSTLKNTAEYKVLNSKKSLDAVKHVLKLTNRESEINMQKLSRDINSTTPPPAIVDDISSLPAGYVLRFAIPVNKSVSQIKGHSYDKDLKVIHTMITTGNGKAIGTENANIGVGSVRGWEEIDLKSKLNYNRELRFFELKKGNKFTEVYIAFDNPFGAIDPRYKNNWDGAESHPDNRSLDEIVREYEGRPKNEYDLAPSPANDGSPNSSSGYARVPAEANGNKQDSQYTSIPVDANGNPQNQQDSRYSSIPVDADGKPQNQQDSRYSSIPVDGDGKPQNQQDSRYSSIPVDADGKPQNQQDSRYSSLPIDANGQRIDQISDDRGFSKLAQVAQEVLTSTDKKDKTIGFKKSWDAVEIMMVRAGLLSQEKARKMIAAKTLVTSSDKKVTKFKDIPAGSLIGFMLPLDNGSERLVHVMISLGNGQAIGTGNATIGQGKPNGIEQVNLNTKPLSTSSTITRKVGRINQDYVVRTTNPLTLSDLIKPVYASTNQIKKDQPTRQYASQYQELEVVPEPNSQYDNLPAHAGVDQQYQDLELKPENQYQDLELSPDPEYDNLPAHAGANPVDQQNPYTAPPADPNPYTAPPADTYQDLELKPENQYQDLELSPDPEYDNLPAHAGANPVDQQNPYTAPPASKITSLDGYDKITNEDLIEPEDKNGEVTPLNEYEKITEDDLIEVEDKNDEVRPLNEYEKITEDDLIEVEESEGGVYVGQQGNPNGENPESGYEDINSPLNQSNNRVNNNGAQAPLDNNIPNFGNGILWKPVKDFQKISTSEWASTDGRKSANAAIEAFNLRGGLFPELNTVEEYVAAAHDLYNNTPNEIQTLSHKNGDVYIYHEDTKTMGIFQSDGTPLKLTRKEAGDFGYLSHEKVCGINEQSSVLDESLPPNNLIGATNKKYNTTARLANYENENLGTNTDPDHEHWKVEYCTVEERKPFELFVKNNLIVDWKGNPMNTFGATRTMTTGTPNMAIFSMDPNGRIYIYTYPAVGRFHHTSFLAGGPVASAGEMKIENGILKEINSRSGHYKPSNILFCQIVQELKARGYSRDIPNLKNFEGEIIKYEIPWVNKTQQHPNGVCEAAASIWLERISKQGIIDANNITAKECDALQARVEAGSADDSYNWNFNLRELLKPNTVFAAAILYNVDTPYALIDNGSKNENKKILDILKEMQDQEFVYISATGGPFGHAVALYKDKNAYYYFDPNHAIYSRNESQNGAEQIAEAITKNLQPWKTIVAAKGRFR